MKIKEVIEKTELTDRAIRLYMENGLIDPYCKEAYNGRKNIDFSEEDVEQLKNIALLRKAGFSIAEIKELQYGGESARIAFTEFIEKTRENIEKNTNVLQLLESLKNEESINIKNICERLSSGILCEGVPNEDLKSTPLERAIKIICYIIGLVGAIWSILNIVITIDYYKSEFMYTTFYEFEPAHMLLIPIRCFFEIQLLLSLLIILLNKKPKKFVKNIKRKRIISIIVVGLWVITWFFVPMAGIMTSFAPPVYSYTENPENYLVLDEFVGRMSGEDISEIFPDNIPRSAVSDVSSWYPPTSFPETTKYFYKYEDLVDESFDIVAEWKLPEEEYKATKEAILGKDGVKAQKQKGDWQCVYFADCENDSIKHTFYFLIFAYNDKTNTVRYISSYCLDAANGAFTPYYFELEW